MSHVTCMLFDAFPRRLIINCITRNGYLFSHRNFVHPESHRTAGMTILTNEAILDLNLLGTARGALWSDEKRISSETRREFTLRLVRTRPFGKHPVCCTWAHQGIHVRGKEHRQVLRGRKSEGERERERRGTGRQSIAGVARRRETAAAAAAAASCFTVLRLIAFQNGSVQNPPPPPPPTTLAILLQTGTDGEASSAP